MWSHLRLRKYPATNVRKLRYGARRNPLPSYARSQHLTRAYRGTISIVWHDAHVERIEADVCVVGAGYSGLTAAWRLTQAGRSVVVLEARDRVGGRVWTENRPDGSAYDRGGGWISPRHERWRALMD